MAARGFEKIHYWLIIDAAPAQLQHLTQHNTFEYVDPRDGETIRLRLEPGPDPNMFTLTTRYSVVFLQHYMAQWMRTLPGVRYQIHKILGVDTIGGGRVLTTN